METPEEPGYCDFCKEPFRKKAAAAPAPAKPAPAVKVGPEVYARLMEAAKPRPPEKPPSEPGIPPEFAHLDSGENIPEVSPAAKTMAWAFLAVVVMWTVVGTLYFAHKAARMKSGVEQGRPSGPR